MAKTDESDSGVRAQVLGSGDPDFQKEALEARREEVGPEIFDANPERYWSSQMGGLPNTGQVAALGPQVYVKEQLPDPAVAQAAGIPPQQISDASLISAEDAVDHPRGPEPGEEVRFIKNAAVNDRMRREASENPSTGEHFTLTSDGVRAIQAAQEGEDAPKKSHSKKAIEAKKADKEDVTPGDDSEGGNPEVEPAGGNPEVEPAR